MPIAGPLRHTSGTLTDWLGTGAGAFTDNWGAFAQSLSTSWQADYLIP